MTKLVFAAGVLIAASIGLVVGTDVAGREHARQGVSAARDALSRSGALRGEVERLRTRFADVKRELDGAQTQAAATAAKAKLLELRVDMVAVEDEIAVLARRR